jgi:hypothetical protein
MESTPFAEALLPTRHDAIAPDGSLVRLLVRLPGGSMAHFELGPRGGLPSDSAPNGQRGVVHTPGAGPDVAPPGRD